jgi:hypothetical protein
VGAGAAGNAAENNALWVPVILIAAAVLEGADKGLTAYDAYQLGVALEACNGGSQAACDSAAGLAQDFAVDSGIELTVGSLIPGSRLAGELLTMVRRNADETTLKAIDKAAERIASVPTISVDSSGRVGMRTEGRGDAPNTGRFSGIIARNADEVQFLRNAEATFGDSSTWTSVTRHRGELVVQRSDIGLSPQNITRMRNGQAPFVRNANGDWEPLQLHHVGRETGQMIEVTRSQNRYNPTTGGPLHIPGPGGPIRQPNYSQSYWQERYEGFVNSGQITE